MFRTRLLLFGLLLIALTLAMGGMSQWAAAEFHYQLVRSQLAHAVRAEYLRLSAQMYPLFQQLVDASAPNGSRPEDGPGLSRLRQAFETTLDQIRSLIAQEVAHTGSREDEQAELHLLARIERQLHSILDATQAALDLKAGGDTPEARAKIADIMDDQINRGFRHLIDEALDAENREVIQTDRDSHAVLQRLTYATGASLAVAIVLGLGSLLRLRRRLNEPLEGLMQGTLAVASGDLSYRMPVTGHDEFSRIASGFNQMADELHQHRCRSEGVQSSLELQVGERTEQLRLANEALSRADQARRQFFADISHELRTPLTVIRGESQFALRGADKGPDVYKDALRRIVDQADQLGRLVDDLLFIARADAGAPRMERTAVALERLLRQVCADAQTLASDKAIHIELQVEVADAVVSGDQGRLRQLFLILLDNAVRYSRAGSEVSVWMGPDPRGVAVRVRDTGAGIPPEELDLVFARFYRGSNALAGHTEGLGLGLPVAKAIAEAHGGEICAQSAVDQGTVITVHLPMVGRLRVAA
jgi:signal transduction histidine kinase